MKRTYTTAEQAAQKATKAATPRMALFGFAIGMVLFLVTPDLSAMHLIIIAALGVSAGLMTARTLPAMARDQMRGVGAGGGGTAGAAYAIPFVAYYFYRFITLNTATLAQRVQTLTAAEVAAAQAQNLQIGIDYFQSRDISYLFFFLMFGWFIGWVFGMIGGLIARRGTSQKAPQLTRD